MCAPVHPPLRGPGARSILQISASLKIFVTVMASVTRDAPPRALAIPRFAPPGGGGGDGGSSSGGGGGGGGGG